MALSVSDLQDLIQLLSDHPEWRAQLRPVILGEELLELPGRMDRVEAALETVGERLEALEHNVAALSGEVRNLTLAVRELVQRTDHTEGALGNIGGHLLELAFEKNLSNWLRDWVRKPRKIGTDDLERLDHAIAAGTISDAEVVQVAWVDALVGARDKDTAEDVVLAIEISQTINADDVERAVARASVLRRAEYDARSFVAGNRISDQARALASATGTQVVLLRPMP